MQKYAVGREYSILEIGCGEGRDANALLNAGFSLLATDISEAAIDFCRRENPIFARNFQVMDCLHCIHPEKHDFIYAVAVVHMLVREEDRKKFYDFFSKHLSGKGIGLICTMGDGALEHQSDITAAFDLEDRIHEQTETPVRIARTSCRIVSLDTFRREIADSGMLILEDGFTAIEPDFPCMMYAVVARK